MSIKLSPTDIVADHIGTLKSAATKQISKFELFVFLGLPAIFSGLGLWFFEAPSAEEAEFAVTIFSILIGLLLNLQVLIFSLAGKISDRVKVDQQKIEDRSRLLHETSANLSFGILMAILFVGFSLYLRYVGADFMEVVFFLSLYSAWSFALTLAMVMKRVHIILSEEVKLLT